MSIQVAAEERGRIDGGLKLFSTMSQSIGYVLIAWLSYNNITEIGFAVVGVILLWASVYMLILYRQQKHQPLLAV
jgi:hypothetical protein